MELTKLEISFARFYKVDKFYWSPDRILVISALLFTLLVSLNKDSLPGWTCYIIFLGLSLFVYRLIKSNFAYEILKGSIKGVIKFSAKSMEFDDHQYSIDAIENISFSFGAKEGERTGAYGKSINGRLSRGVDNSVDIKFKDGKTNAIYFQVPKNFDLELLKPILISYTQNNLISFNNLISLLNFNYKEVQELKNKYFSNSNEINCL